MRAPRETWVDAVGSVVYVSNTRNRESDRLSKGELEATKCLITGTVKTARGTVFLAPFKQVRTTVEDDGHGSIKHIADICVPQKIAAAFIAGKHSEDLFWLELNRAQSFVDLNRSAAQRLYDHLGKYLALPVEMRGPK